MAGLKLARATQTEIERLRSLLRLMDSLGDQLMFNDFDDIDVSDIEDELEILSPLDKDAETYLAAICKELSKTRYTKILMNLDVLLENCANLD